MTCTMVLLALLFAHAEWSTQPPVFNISGVIVNADGERLRPARAIARRQGETGVSGTTWSSTKEGRFTILNLAPGEYRLFLEALPFETLKGRPVRHFAGVRVTVAADVTDLTVTAMPGVTLHGRLVPPNDGDRPAPDLRNLWVVAVGVDGRATALAMIGLDGRFTLAEVFGPVRISLSALPEGYVVRAVMLGHADITGQLIEVAPDETRELRIVLGRG